jgi:hypothetical protein
MLREYIFPFIAFVTRKPAWNREEFWKFEIPLEGRFLLAKETEI